MLLSGLHMPNATIIDDDISLLYDYGAKRLRFQAAKLSVYQGTQHTVGDALRLRAMGLAKITMRLWDSLEYADNPDGYSEKCIATVQEFAGAGVFDYQLDNEPNVSWLSAGKTAGEYREWQGRVIDHLAGAGRLPAGVRFGFPPMCFTPQWKPYEWLGALIDIAPHFQFLCVNSYWQSDRQGRTNILAGPMTWAQFGGNCEFYGHWQAGMPIQLTEWANSIHEQQIGGQPVFTPAQVDAFRREQYPIYLEWLATHPSVEVAFVYISRGATDQWGGFKFPIDVADAMAAWWRGQPIVPVLSGSGGGMAAKAE